MIDGYTITSLPSDIELYFKAHLTEEYKPNFNASPTQRLPVILNYKPNEIVMATWGYIQPSAGNQKMSPKYITKKIDSFKEKTAMKKSSLERRCLILADGFYSWKKMSGRSKVPYRIVPKREKIICFAGIWNESEMDFRGHKMKYFSIILRNAYIPVSDITESMPVVLNRSEGEKWLQADFDAEKHIHMMEMEDWDFFSYYPVSPAISDPKINSPKLIKPVQPVDQFGNLTLFG